MPPPRHPTLFQSYGERSQQPNLTALATYLLRLIHLKKTNLCVSADVTSTAELLQLAEDVGDHICLFKTHADIISDFTDRTVRGLQEIAKRKRFIIFEDRKFLDIGNTVELQYTSGPCSIVRWAQIVNATVFSGPDIIATLAAAARKAIASHNSSVQTEITASPAHKGHKGTETVESEDEEEDDDGDYDDDDDENDNFDDSEVEESEDDDDDERKGRKHSVVSVSTTISTKTETISPQPSLRPSISRGSTDEHDDASDEEEDVEAAWEELGPTPFYRSLLLLAEMSSRDNRFSAEYTDACVKDARANKDFVMGFIAQRSLNSEKDDNFITITPGVQLEAGGDAKGQQYNTPRKVIGDAGCDVMIVGRGILQASDRRKAALEYRKQGWMAYEERIKSGRRRR